MWKKGRGLNTFRVHCIFIVPVNSLDTPTHSRVFLYFYYFLHCRIIVMKSKLWDNTYGIMNQTKKVLNKWKYTLYVIFFLVATHCFDKSNGWHSLNQLHLECFSNSLEGVPTYVEHLFAVFPSLCGPTHPTPSQLGWGQYIVEVRSSDATIHHSPSWSNSP